VKPGDEIAGRYRLDELRGRGAMSEVWRAHDERLDRTVALKLLSPTADLERFRREAQAVAALAHENVMRVFDYGEDPAGPFMALEWLAGGTLEERLAVGALPTPDVERVARGIAAGLAHLHERGFVHRDLKPANVLFDEEDRPKLADLGLARIAAGAGTLTEAGTVLGTAAYISPEQAAGLPAGPASDVYSFGVILFRMLTGALPFSATDTFELMRLHRTAEPPPVEELNPDAPPALAALAAASLRKDPSVRPPDGTALLARLGPAEATGEDTQILGPPIAAAAGRSRRSAALAAALLVLALAGGGLAWAVTRPDSPAASGTRPTTGGVLATGHTRHRTTTPATSTYTPPTTYSRPTTRTRTHPTTTARTTTARTTTHAATTAPPPPTTAPPPTTTTVPPPTTTALPPTTTATGTTVTSTTGATTTTP
jgi:serine/threonine-protein kinase